MITPYDDTYFMKKALEEAKAAFDKGEIPVGAVIVIDNRIIARTHNLTETLTDVTAHAEMQAITAAANFLGGKYLKGCTLYVTLEPCQMCAGALYWSQIDKIVYGAKDAQRGCGAMGTTLHPKTSIVGGVLEEEASMLMKRFFIEKTKFKLIKKRPTFQLTFSTTKIKYIFYPITCTLVATNPFLPSSSEYSTLSPSLSSTPLSAVTCTKMSLPVSSFVMNPKPLDSLKNLTVPVM